MRYVRSAFPDLHALRSRRGISLRQVADATRIRVYYLEAIENGEFDKLPGGVYTRSYVRQYAQAIDLEEECLLQALPPLEREEFPERPPPGARFWLWLLRFVSAGPVGGPAESGRTG